MKKCLRTATKAKRDLRYSSYENEQQEIVNPLLNYKKKSRDGEIKTQLPYVFDRMNYHLKLPFSKIVRVMTIFGYSSSVDSKIIILSCLSTLDMIHNSPFCFLAPFSRLYSSLIVCFLLLGTNHNCQLNKILISILGKL